MYIQLTDIRVSTGFYFDSLSVRSIHGNRFDCDILPLLGLFQHPLPALPYPINPEYAISDQRCRHTVGE